MWWSILIQFAASILAGLIHRKTLIKSGQQVACMSGPNSLTPAEIETQIDWWNTIVALLPKLQSVGADVFVVINIVIAKDWGSIIPALQKLLNDLQASNPNPPGPNPVG